MSPQAIHQRDELAERVAEVEEELAMAIQEIKKLDNANKQMSDVCQTVINTHLLCVKYCISVKWSDLVLAAV